MLYNSLNYTQCLNQAQLTQLDRNKTNTTGQQQKLAQANFYNPQKQFKRKHALQEAEQLLSAPLCTWCVSVLLQEVLMHWHLLLPDI